MNTVYSSNGPFGSAFEVYADDGGDDIRLVGETRYPDAMIEADKANDFDLVEALRFREIIADVADGVSHPRFEAGNAELGTYRLGVMAKFRAGAAALR